MSELKKAAVDVIEAADRVRRQFDKVEGMLDPEQLNRFKALMNETEMLAQAVLRGDLDDE